MIKSNFIMSKLLNRYGFVLLLTFICVSKFSYACDEIKQAQLNLLKQSFSLTKQTNVYMDDKLKVTAGSLMKYQNNQPNYTHVKVKLLDANFSYQDEGGAEPFTNTHYKCRDIKTLKNGVIRIHLVGEKKYVNFYYEKDTNMLIPKSWQAVKKAGFAFFSFKLKMITTYTDFHLLDQSKITLN